MMTLAVPVWPAATNPLLCQLAPGHQPSRVRTNGPQFPCDMRYADCAPAFRTVNATLHCTSPVSSSDAMSVAPDTPVTTIGWARAGRGDMRTLKTASRTTRTHRRRRALEREGMSTGG